VSTAIVAITMSGCGKVGMIISADTRSTEHPKARVSHCNIMRLRLSQLGHSLPIHLAPVPANVRYYPIATFQDGVSQHIPPENGLLPSR
jgi:hypothetical protein